MAHKARICIFVAISDPDSTAAQIGGYASSHDCRVSCSQQSPGVQRLGLVAGPAALARQETGGPLCAVRADLPGLCGGIEDACGPKSPGSHPGGLGPHLTPSGFPWRAFLRFPVCPPRFVPGARLRMVSLRPAFSGCTLRPSPGSGSPPGSLPPGDPHVSAAAGRCRRRWSRSARTKVTSSASAPSLGSPAIRPRCRRAEAGHERCRRRIAWYERPRAHTVTASSRNC